MTTLPPLQYVPTKREDFVARRAASKKKYNKNLQQNYPDRYECKCCRYKTFYLGCIKMHIRGKLHKRISDNSYCFLDNKRRLVMHLDAEYHIAKYTKMD